MPQTRVHNFNKGKQRQPITQTSRYPKEERRKRGAAPAGGAASVQPTPLVPTPRFPWLCHAIHLYRTPSLPPGLGNVHARRCSAQWLYFVTALCTISRLPYTRSAQSTTLCAHMCAHIQEEKALFDWAGLVDVEDDVHEFEQCRIILKSALPFCARLFSSYDTDLESLTNRQKAFLRKRLLCMSNIDKVCFATLFENLGLYIYSFCLRLAFLCAPERGKRVQWRGLPRGDVRVCTGRGRDAHVCIGREKGCTCAHREGAGMHVCVPRGRMPVCSTARPHSRMENKCIFAPICCLHRCHWGHPSLMLGIPCRGATRCRRTQPFTIGPCYHQLCNRGGTHTHTRPHTHTHKHTHKDGHLCLVTNTH